MDTATMLLEFSAVAGVAGAESQAAIYGRKLLEKYGEVSISPLGNVICTIHPKKQGQPHIMLDAHMDEIGMIVTYIEDAGFLRVANCGGIDRRLLLASAVTLHTKSGKIHGVVCSIPPHLAGDDAPKNKKVDEIYIDIGFDKPEVLNRVQLGDRVTINASSAQLLGNCVSGKAMDDRAGCIALVKALEYLADNPLNIGLTVVFSVMEEVGGQGAQTAAYTVNPTHAIAVDVTFAHTPDSDKEKCGLLKKGPMIGYSPILSTEMSDTLALLASRQCIPFQQEVMGGKTGTNADSIATSRNGVCTALLSIPQKYMHTPIETVAVCDVENTAKLIAEYILWLDKEVQ